MIKGIKKKVMYAALTGLAALVLNCGIHPKEPENFSNTTKYGYNHNNPSPKQNINKNNDSDRDGISNDIELRYGLNPNDPDQDDDGLIDGNIFCEDLNADGVVDDNETDPKLYDTDGDGLSDGQEKGLAHPEWPNFTDAQKFKADKDPSTRTSPTNQDTDGDGLLDGEEDTNLDGAVDLSEYNPRNIDSDANGYTDGFNLPVPLNDSNDKTPPLAVFTAIPDFGKAPLIVSFNSDGSFDPESGIANYYWDFDGDQRIDSNEHNPTFTYAKPGIYYPALIITNGSGLFASSKLENIINIDGYVDKDDDSFTYDIDCDDLNSGINPGAAEIPYNGTDDDCNPLTVDDDLDGDSFSLTQDCNDASPNINPNAIEVCDNADNNCNGIIDEGVLDTYYLDNDSDGYGSQAVQSCVPELSYVTNSLDCDDTNASVNPGLEEICDKIDNNCDGNTDENNVCGPFEYTADSNTIALYHFNEGSGNIAYDSSGNANHGSIINNPVWSTDSPLATNSSLQFNGINYIDIPRPFNGIQNDYTIEMFFKTDKAQGGYNIGSDLYRHRAPYYDTMVRFWEQSSPGVPSLNILAGTGANPDDSLNFGFVYPYNYNDDQWHHIAFSYNGNTAKLHLDNILVAEQIKPTNVNWSINFIKETIAGNPVDGQQGYIGKLDEVRISNMQRY